MDLDNEELKATKKIYLCDINKNQECKKKYCYINGGTCRTTTDKTKAIDNMNEEEKKAKENLDKLLADWDNEDISEIDLFILKRLIEKQQKEIEELKKENKQLKQCNKNLVAEIEYLEEK